MKLGLIARADNTGLGIQSWEFHRHMAPERTLVIDVGHLADNGSHCNKATFADRYPDAILSRGWMPARETMGRFLHGLDAVFMAETPYNPLLLTMARAMRVHSVLQYNWEFLDQRHQPSLFAAPSTWHYGDLDRPNKCLLPVPIATDRFTARAHPRTAEHFLHIVGRPAVHDRNGTGALLAALEHVTAKVTVTLKCQEPGYLGALCADLRTADNVTLRIDSGRCNDYWDNYTAGDVLVMPRRFGGLCLPVQEALAAGMPVIMPAIAPNTDWLPPGWLVPASHQGQFMSRSHIDLYSTHPQALAAKIDHFATDPDFYAAARTGAAELAESMSWATLKPEYDAVLSPR